MDNQTIVNKDLGPETKLTVKYEDGQLKINIDQQGKLGGSGAYIVADAVKVIDAITDVIPGEWDDKLLDSMAEKFLTKKSA